MKNESRWFAKEILDGAGDSGAGRGGERRAGAAPVHLRVLLHNQLNECSDELRKN